MSIMSCLMGRVVHLDIPVLRDMVWELLSTDTDSVTVSSLGRWEQHG